MLLEPLFILVLALLGLISGFLAGLLGIGGGLIIAPVLLAMLSTRGVEQGLAMKMSIATAMAVIVLTSLSSLRAHHRRGAVRWDIVRAITPGIVGGGLLASMAAFSILKGPELALFFTAFVFFSGTQMLLDRKPKPTRQLPGPAGLAGAGGAIGFLSGLVGAGGGFISVPFLVWCNVAVHNAVATSAALGFPIALVNTVGYILSGWGQPGLPPYALGYVWAPAWVILASCSVWMAPIGAKAAHALPVAKLKRILAFMLYGLGTYMLYKTWVA